jgi:hypothetical protein
MPLVIRMVSRILTLSALFAANAFCQSADISGWSELRWGTTKPVALKTLQPLGAHEGARADVLIVEKYNFNNVPFTVNLLFSKNGFARATMTAEDKRDAFEKVLSALSVRYGKPELQSEYDGDEELTHTTWIWRKAQGKLSLESDETSGFFTMTYESRR